MAEDKNVENNENTAVDSEQLTFERLDDGFFAHMKLNWEEDFTDDEIDLAIMAFDLLEDLALRDKKPQVHFIAGVMIPNFMGFEDATEELKSAIAEEIIHQWELAHPEEMEAERKKKEAWEQASAAFNQGQFGSAAPAAPTAGPTKCGNAEIDYFMQEYRDADEDSLLRKLADGYPGFVKIDANGFAYADGSEESVRIVSEIRKALADAAAEQTLTEYDEALAMEGTTLDRVKAALAVLEAKVKAPKWYYDIDEEGRKTIYEEGKIEGTPVDAFIEKLETFFAGAALEHSILWKAHPGRSTCIVSLSVSWVENGKLGHEGISLRTD